LLAGYVLKPGYDSSDRVNGIMGDGVVEDIILIVRKV
jgi:hypothetical protein